jgi:hypothetical protein
MDDMIISDDDPEYIVFIKLYLSYKFLMSDLGLVKAHLSYKFLMSRLSFSY